MNSAEIAFKAVPGAAVRVGGAGFCWKVHGDDEVTNADRPRAAPVSPELPSPIPPSREVASRVTSLAVELESPVNEDQKDSPQTPEVAGFSPKQALQTETAPTTTRLESILLASNVSLEDLRGAAWGGVPWALRGTVWKLLLGYLPTNAARRTETLQRKRQAYWEAVGQHYHSPDNGQSQERTDEEEAIHRQISVDVPRTCPGLALFHTPEIQESLLRMLYVWAVRHPASSYVQGMNDLVTPFLFAFLFEVAHAAPLVDCSNDAAELLDRTDLTDLSGIADVEADAYWCLTALLDKIHDYFTFAQPGIQRRVFYMKELIGRVDGGLKDHLARENLDFMQFAFRWMNCLLMRELPFLLTVRVWDTYMAEPDGFAVFHVYVCAALLHHFSEQLQELEFQDLVMFLQNVPTDQWTTKEIDIVLGQAYMWRTIFGAGSSSAHLAQKI